MSKKTAQSAQILQYLKSGRGITAIQALEKFGCLRLAARIWELRADGYDITTQMVTVKDGTYAMYSLKTR